MTFMPKFEQSTAEHSHEYQVRREADLLANQSRIRLSRRLVELNLAAPESVYQSRLEDELQVITEKGYSGYFLIVADYVQWAKDHEIAVGPGRGSGPCSLVGFAMGITNVDPIRYQLPFERFVNPERDSLPDFDLDFCEDRRGEVTSYIQSKYGVDRVAQISSDETTPLPSRLVICDRPLADLVPLYSNPESGFPAAKLTLAQVADAGLVQFNAINQKALTLIQHRVRELRAAGHSVDIDKIPLDDSGAYQLLSAGEESNIAVLDREHYRSILKLVQPNSFAELCAVIALAQSRFQHYLELYIARKNDSSKLDCFHPVLKDITSETYGLILYQEQVMHIARKVAGFTFAQGDLYRRALMRSDREALSIFNRAFVQGAVGFGLPEAEARSLFEHLSLSCRYSFNKSHAVSFATIAYQSAWLKANY